MHPSWVPTLLLALVVAACGLSHKSFQCEARMRRGHFQAEEYTIAKGHAIDDDDGLAYKCEHGAGCHWRYNFVCGSNNRTFAHACWAKDASLHAVSEGPCPESEDRCSSVFCYRECYTTQGYVECATNVDGEFTCPYCWELGRPKNIVCGSDGKTYDNKCELEEAACRRKDPSLYLVAHGKCRRNHKPWPELPPADEQD